MFSGNRRFNGRQGEQILNEELYVLYEILKHFLDVPDNPNPHFGPQSGLEKPGALWLDRQTAPGYAHLMYRDSDKVWKPIFDDWFKIIKDIRNPNGKPDNPTEGQLWIDENGILHWFNGSIFVPIKGNTVDSGDLNVNSFQNFLIIDPLKMSGGYIVENLSKLTQIAGGITQWRPNNLYQLGDLVYYTDHHGETFFYQYSDKEVNWGGQPHTSAMTFQEELDSKYLQKVDLKAQYLIPSEVLGKVFIDGFYTNSTNYEKISDVCIQISLSLYQGKAVAAVHVNPIALKNIRKRIIRIEKDPGKFGEYAMIKVGPDNTEYYGFIDGFGQLLLKQEDYLVKANGIQLIGDALDRYDFIYAITYEFETKIKNKGVLYKNTVNLNNQTSIWIGQIDPADKLLVFVQGLCLEDFYWSYDPFDPSGLIKFNGYDKDGNITDDPNKMVKPLFEGKSDVAILRFRKKTNIAIFTPDILTEVNTNGKITYDATVTIPADYTKPLIFVQGPHLNVTLGDYTIQGDKAIIKDVNPGAAYYIVDAVRHDGFNMYIGEGTIPATEDIEILDPQILSGECQPLVFVDGFYVSIRDLDRSDPNKIKIHGLTQGQDYVLLKDKEDEFWQLLFDGEVSFTTIPMPGEIDDAVVYIGSSVIVDGGACYSTSASKEYAASNEIKLILADGIEKWRYYNAGADAWEIITDDDFAGKLELASSGYSVDTRTINILQNFGEIDCTYYAYRFADNIEKPLIKGYTSNYTIIGNEVFYKLDFRHAYPVGENSLHVWMNGVKQAPVEHHIVEVDPITGKQRTVQGFLLPKATDENGVELNPFPTCFYIIERPETGEYKACATEVLGQPVGLNTYVTNGVILAPGVPRVYIDGYRQPQSAYLINNMNTITIIEPVLTDANNTVMVTDRDGKNAFVTADSRSQIIVEVRQDYRLKEKTVVLTQDNLNFIIQGATAVFDSTTVFANKQTLPGDLFVAKDTEICIYINGAAYGKDFKKIRNQDTIVLTNLEAVQTLQVGDSVTFEWR